MFSAVKLKLQYVKLII